MNKNEYIKELEKCLKYLPQDEKEDALAFYNEYLGDMELADDEDVLTKLGTPKEVAKEILDNCTAKAVNEQKDSKSVKGSGKIVWLVILGIASLPVSLPLSIAALAIVIALLLTVFAVLLAFVLAAVGLVLAGLVGLAKTLFVPGLASKLVSIGVSLAFIGFGVLALVGTVELFKLIIRALGNASVKRREKKEGEKSHE